FFLVSWTEWGEGNYMEPDRRFGKGYIIALRKVIFND
ncbi:glycoside hydrolase family 99-like domain-containing protein, partial [Flavobacterium sp. B17]